MNVFFKLRAISSRAIVQSVLLTGLLGGIGQAESAPVLGAQLFWTGGDVTIEVQGATAGFLSELRLYHGATSDFIAFNAPNGTPVGTTITLLAAAIDVNFDLGDELVFGIFVTNTSQTFKLGPAARNPDNIIHGAIDSTARAGWLRVGFEDILGGGDLDYDDNVFDFRGSVVTGSVPEPGSLALVGLAALTAWGASKRSSKLAKS